LLDTRTTSRESNLARALAFEGANARLKRVIRKAMRGEKIKIGILGGSVTAGHGVKEHDRWSTLYGNWWREAFPKAEIEVTNGAVPATETSYYMTCFEEHIDKDVDIVVIEMGINDRRCVSVSRVTWFGFSLEARFDSLAQSYEYLLRALLELPNQPAVINLHVSHLFPI
jgi:lysophospholipase L1-like esterase